MTDKELSDFIEHGSNRFMEFALVFGDGWASQAIEIAKELRTRLAHPEPEGYRWEEGRTPPSVTYTAPLKKEWGGVMTDKQPEALRLADEADHRDFGLDPEPTWIKNAAAELRRLHEENETLRSKLIEPKLEQENDMKKYFASPNPWKLMP